MFKSIRTNFKSRYSVRQFLFIALTFAVLSSSLNNSVFAAPAPDNNWRQTQAKATTALDANEYWIAEPLLLQALAQANKFKQPDPRLAKTLSELGRLYTIRGRFEEAEAYFEEELTLAEMIHENDKFKCIPTMGSMIQFYLMHGTQTKALPLAEEMLAMVEGKLNEAKAGSTKTRLQKGVPLQGWLGVAAPAAKDPIIEWAITCDAVGNTYKDCGDYTLANRLYNAALDIKTTVLGQNHLSIANSYDNLGSLCLEKQDLNQAESYFADALKITEKTLSPDSPQVYNRLDKLGKCLIKQGKAEEAKNLYLRALTFWPDENSNYGSKARAQFSLGSIYTQEHKYDEALPHLQEALQLAQQVYGPHSIALVPYLQKYAYALYYLGRKEEMKELNSRANMISGTTIKNVNG